MQLFTLLLMLFCVNYMLRHPNKPILSGSPADYIQYDKRYKKIFIIVALVCTIFWVLSVITLGSREFMDRIQSSIILTSVLFGYILAPIVAVVCCIKFVECCWYFKRLIKYGYERPDKKEKYSYMLQYLPREKTTQSMNKGNSAESMMLTGITVYIGMSTLAGGVWLLLKYLFLGNDAWFIFGMICFMALGWIVAGIFFWRQRNNQKYKDDVEPDSTRKSRKHLANQLIPILIGMAITAGGILILQQMAEVIYRTRLANGWYQ